MRVLYVDDDADLREIASMALALDPGMDVRVCDDGHAALAMVAEWRPDLILLDMMMPGLDGPATFAQMREHPSGSDVPIVFITARSQDRDIERLMALGAHGVIAKPFDVMNLAAQVRAMVGTA